MIDSATGTKGYFSIQTALSHELDVPETFVCQETKRSVKKAISAVLTVVGLTSTPASAQVMAAEEHRWPAQETRDHTPDSNYRPSDKQKKWALATGAVLTAINNDRHDRLGGISRNRFSAHGKKWLLKEWWNIETRTDLLRVLDWLDDGGGHRREWSDMGAQFYALTDRERTQMKEDSKGNVESLARLEIIEKHYESLGDTGILAWDYCRYVLVCGWGYVAGYLTKREAWKHMMPIARILQATFDSWEELGENYAIGRDFWSGGRLHSETDAALKTLLTSPNSPWNKYPWNLDLGN